MRKHGMCLTSTYKSWRSMKTRTTNPNLREWHRYGGRGIKICERWMEFENFLVDMGEKPTPRHSIDRLDNDGHYEPENCRWATPVEQCATRSTTKLNWVGVCLMRNMYARGSRVGDVAHAFGVGHATASRIVARKERSSWL